MNFGKTASLFALSFITVTAVLCTRATFAQDSKGVGPVTHVDIAATVDAALATKGKAVFETKCSACHKLDERYVGPALGGVTTRRTPEWVMNMILNPVEMTQKDPVAQEMFGEFLIQMTFQNVSQDEARQILEYFREVDSKK
jgi:mono/diheme cytochrome c family protein